MKKNEHSKFNYVDIMLWLAIVFVTAAAFIGTYQFHFTAPIIALIWVGWLVVTSLLGFFTNVGEVVYSFSKESKQELQKVVWPGRQETIQTTSIVMIMVTVTGLILWGVDAGMMWAIGKITHLG